MVSDQAILDRVFHALAHPARRAMLQRLAEGERNLSELAAPLKMTFPAASKHVRVLESARLVRRNIHGRTHICRLEVAPLDQVSQWTEQCRQRWEVNFTRLDAILDELKAAHGLGSAPAEPESPATRKPRPHRRKKA